MRPSRVSMGAAASLFASMLSFGPAPSAGQAAPPEVRAAAIAPAAPEPGAHDAAWPPPGVREIGAPVPADVRAHIDPLADGGVRIRVERKGHIVALRHRDASSAGRDWAAIELYAGPGAGAPDRDALVWEATDFERLETTRGLVHVERGGESEPAARIALAEPPGRGLGLSGGAGAHACASHRDGGGGFVVLCKLGREARAARAVNLTGARPLEGAWIVEPGGRGRAAVARLELPRSAALAEARAVTYVRGVEGIVLRAEAVWPPTGGLGAQRGSSARSPQASTGGLGAQRGSSARSPQASTGEPTLLLDESRRAQPLSDFGRR